MIRPLLTVGDVSKRWRVARSTIYDWVRQGKIPFVPLPGAVIRFDPEIIASFKSRLQSKAPVQTCRQEGIPRDLKTIIARAKGEAYNPRPRGNQHKREPKKGG